MVIEEALSGKNHGEMLCVAPRLRLLGNSLHRENQARIPCGWKADKSLAKTGNLRKTL